MFLPKARSKSDPGNSGELVYVTETRCKAAYLAVQKNVAQITVLSEFLVFSLYFLSSSLFALMSLFVCCQRFLRLTDFSLLI